MDRSDRLSRTASVAYTKGLLNNPGENNCFLNSAVQVLWHLDVFRRSFRELSGHFCVGESCIFCALKVIFTQIQYSDEAALPPDALRQALAVTFKDQQRFQLQDMDDAAECLENILSRLHFHFAMNEKDEICSAGHCISHRKFAMEIMEQSVCNCGATSEPLPFFQLVHYVSVTALCQEAEILSSKLKGLDQDMFGHLLKRAVNQGDTRECPGNCGKRISVQQSLLNCPDVVCIGLIWDSDNPDIEQISELLDCVDPVLRLPEVFPRVSDDKAKKVELLLAGVVTYYGKHYSTFSYSNKMKTWIYFDDARVRKCGPDWEKIRDRCRKNHYQPLLLLFVNPHGRPVSTKSAPSEVKLVDTKTLLASPESARKHSGATSDKTTDIIGGSPSSTPEIKRKSRQGDSVDSLVSSPSSHSLGSEPGSEKDVESSAAERKKSKRSMKRLKTFGSDIKRALSRNKNESQPAELRNSSRSLHSLSTAKVESVKKSSSHDDLINLNEDARHKNILSLYEGPTRARELDECDSGLGSGGSQASSPATSSVSSVDTNTDDLIDFSTRTFPRSRGNDSNHKVDSMVEEAESHLRRSYELEKAGEIALSLSFVTNATTRFRIAIEHCSTSHNPSFLTKLRNKYNLCLERSRDLHQRITAEKEARRLQFSQQQKQELLMKQRERDKQVLRENRQPTTSQGTLPRSFTKDRDLALEVKGVVPMSSWSINEVYLRDNRSKSAPSSPVSVRRPNSRTHHPGSIGTTRKPSDEDMRDSENCSQKIKPDALCYSPVHYGKLTSVCNDFERMKFANESSPQSRKTTVTHVSTSFVPERSLPIEQALLTSSVYALPNSRNSTKDIRRCSIYDNMPPSGDRRYASTVPLRTVITSSCTSNTPPQRVCNSGVERRSKAWSTPVYVDPPPYDRSRTQQNTGNFRDQSGTLLQRFNVPVASRGVETVGLPDDVPRMNGGVRAYRPLCQRCRKTYVEKNARCCRPCQALDNMLCDLKDDTAMHY